DHVACELLLSERGDAGEAISRCRRLLDLDADPAVVDAHLSADPVLAPLVARGRGRRIPGSVDGGEMAIRAVLGQQISTAAARTVAGRLAAELGEPIADPDGAIERLFPTADALLGLRLPGPARRAQTLTAVATALVSGELSLGPGSDRGAARAVLARLPGIGPWTTEILMMRALGDPDAFPASDLGVRRAAEALGLPASPAALLIARSRAWSPWRAYAVQYLWSTLPHAINVWPAPSYPL
ncbi:MAG: DNA-3-methyladenine glycosylase family protein, partial [Solirubrobacteraceae bacterium]